ncbi:MAG: CoA transferase [Pseudomonadales bacterium]
MIAHPQVQATGIVTESEHPHAGRIRQARNAARFEGTPAELRMGAPHLGEHTRALLRELGYDDDSQQALLDGGIVSSLHAVDA